MKCSGGTGGSKDGTELVTSKLVAERLLFFKIQVVEIWVVEDFGGGVADKAPGTSEQFARRSN